MKNLHEKLDRASFAMALTLHRDRLNITQAEAAEIINVSARKYWQMEKKERDTSKAEQIGALELLKNSTTRGSIKG